MIDAPETNINIEKESKEAAAYKRLSDVVKCLRNKGGCPWDLKQTPLSMRRDLMEEAFEAIDAISQEDAMHAKEELGDVLLNTIMIAYMYEQEKNFEVADVINEVADKIVRRHPHVFNKSEGSACMTETVDNSEKVLAQWDKIKETVEGRSGEKSILDEVPQGFPPLLKAYKMQKKASKKGFDWTSEEPVIAKIIEELDEVKQAVAQVKEAKQKACEDSKAHTTQSTKELDNAQLDLEGEIGDLLFAVVNYARHVDVDPAIALDRTNQKFYRRFSFVEQKMKEANIEMTNENLAKMDEFWDEAKANEKKA